MKKLLICVSLAAMVAAGNASAQDRRDRSAYASRRDSPYSNESVRRDRRERDTARNIERDRKSKFYKFRDAKRDRDDDDDDREDDE